jgi:hypothetical protein
MAYLSIWSLYQDEAPYMREWIEFHRLVGVEHFFLYDHYSADHHREALAPYVEDGIVTLHDWPIDPGQVQAANHCLEHHREDSRWIAFLDLDEFLFSPTGRPLPEVLTDYERWPGVVVNWASFGTSGHPTPPDGLVIESYVMRTNNPAVNGHKKSIVQPRRVVACRGGLYDFADGHSVDENMQPSDGQAGDTVSFSKLRINHYHTKSEIEFERKIAKPRADRRGVRRVKAALREEIVAGLNELRDEALVPYAPAVREALERMARRAPERSASPSPDEQAIMFARDVLAGVALCAEDGVAYPHLDLVDKAIRLLSPAGIGRPQPQPPEGESVPAPPAAAPVEAAADN